jgi:hypothetical protein
MHSDRPAWSGGEAGARRGPPMVRVGVHVRVRVRAHMARRST